MPERREQPVPLPSLEEVCGRTRQAFLSTETYDHIDPSHPLYGRVKAGYAFWVAARDTVRILAQEGVDMIGLFSGVLRETSITPDQMDGSEWSELDEAQTWGEFIQVVLSNVIEREMPLRYPELAAEEEKRININPWEVH